MDRNQAIGLSIMGALLLGYFWWSSTQEPPATATTTPDSTTVAAPDSAESPTTPDFSALVERDSLGTDSAKQAALAQAFGAFAPAAEGEETLVTLENEEVTFQLASHGAQVHSAQLKDYKDGWGQPLYLARQGQQQQSLMLSTTQGRVNTSELYFQVTDQTDSTVTFVAQTSSGGSLTIGYTLPATGYELKQAVVSNALPLASQEVVLQWLFPLQRLESDQGIQQQKPTFNYYHHEEGYDEISIDSDEPVKEQLEPLAYNWLTVKQKYFTTGLITNQGLRGAEVSSVPEKADSTLWNTALTNVQMQFEGDTLAGGVTWYYGPNKYYEMNNVTEGFGKNVYLGPVIINLITRYLILPIFHFVDQFVGNFGIIIIILVLIIKGALFPLSYKSYLGMAKMRILKPEIEKLKEQYPDDNAKQQQEQLKLFQQAGVSPLSGCIPMLLQMPFLFAMFYFFPNSIEIRQESFLWADDLSTYDAVINLPFTIPFYGSHVSLFTFLMTLSTLLYTWMNNQVSGTTGPMKNIGYVMPVVFMFVLNSFPAALSFYYFVSNLVTFGQQWGIRRFVDDSKIERIMEENQKKRAANASGKSGFQARLSDMMKQQQEIAKQRQQQKGKKKK